MICRLCYMKQKERETTHLQYFQIHYFSMERCRGRLNITMSYQYKIPIMKIWRSHDRLIFIMEINIPGNTACILSRWLPGLGTAHSRPRSRVGKQRIFSLSIRTFNGDIHCINLKRCLKSIILSFLHSKMFAADTTILFPDADTGSQVWFAEILFSILWVNIEAETKWTPFRHFADDIFEYIFLN